VINISNIGTTILRPKAKIEIFKGNKKITEINWPYFEVGFKETKDFEYLWEKTPIGGFYKAKLTFWDGSGQEVLKEASFFIFPFTYSFLVLLIAIISLLVYKKYRQKTKSSKTKQK
jgi:hypothetical protein